MHCRIQTQTCSARLEDNKNECPTQEAQAGTPAAYKSGTRAQNVSW